MAKKVEKEQVTEQVTEQVLPSVTIDKLINNEYNYDMIQNYNDNGVIKTDNDNGEIGTLDTNTVKETEELQYNDVDYSGRGFNSLEDAIKYMNSNIFKNLGDADKNEFKKWLIKED